MHLRLKLKVDQRQTDSRTSTPTLSHLSVLMTDSSGGREVRIPRLNNDDDDDDDDDDDGTLFN